MSTTLKIEMMDISKLVPYKNNAKLHPQEQIDQIKSSIQQFGNNDPIAIDKDNVIIEGHGRMLALEQLGHKEVPVIRLGHLSDEQRKAYTLIHNQLTMNSGFDLELLKIELDDIVNIDMTEFDFDYDFPEEDEEVQEDDYEVELPVEPKSKLGDIYQLGNHRLMCGDSTSKEDVAKLMGDDKADMVFTDPPWNVNYGDVEKGNAQCYKPRKILNDFMGTEDFKEFMISVFARMNESSKPGAMTYVVMSAQEWGNMMLALGVNDYHWSSTIIWAKDSMVLSRKDYHTQYEPIWYGWKMGESRLHPVPDRKQTDLWNIPRPKRSDLHPTMKPIELVARAITNSSNKGNVVLDLFGGSGSTMIACEKTGRSNRSMELDPQYVDVIIDRWEELTGDKAVKVN